MGFKITDVIPGSPAQKMGLKIGDILVSFNGQQVVNDAELAAAVQIGLDSEEQVATAEVQRMGVVLALSGPAGELNVRTTGGIDRPAPAASNHGETVQSSNALLWVVGIAIIVILAVIL